MRKIMNEKLTITTSNPVRVPLLLNIRVSRIRGIFIVSMKLFYVGEGEKGDCLVGDSIISYSKGDLILFGSELPHSMQSPPDDGGRI